MNLFISTASTTAKKGMDVMEMFPLFCKDNKKKRNLHEKVVVSVIPL